MKNLCIFYIFSFNNNTASHRLRLSAAPRALGAEIIINKHTELFPLLITEINPFKCLSYCQPGGFDTRKKFLIASKPFSIRLLAFLFVCKYLLNFEIVVDISDNHLFKKQGLRRSLLAAKQCLSYCLAFKVTCPTYSMVSGIPKVFRPKTFVVEDLIDLQSVSDYPCRAFEQDASMRILWFGNAGTIDSNGNLNPSESIVVLWQCLKKLLNAHQGDINDSIKGARLYVCSNNSLSVANYFSSIQNKLLPVHFVEWSPVELRNQLGLAGGVLLTYSNSRYSSSKSPNRLQTALASGLPTIAVNPPVSCQELNQQLLKVTPSLPLFLCSQNEFGSKIKLFFQFLSSSKPLSNRDFRLIRTFFADHDKKVLLKWKKILLSKA